MRPGWRVALHAGLPQTGLMQAYLPFVVAILACAGLWAAWRIRQRSQTRQRAIHQLLDAADALEARLRMARGEIEAVAGDHENPVRGAMQDLLRQRLWLQQHALDASLAQLEGVRSSLDSARASLEQQLERISRARAGAA